MNANRSPAAAAGDPTTRALLGTWELAMRTPVGTMHATLTFHDETGTVIGTAAGKGETVQLRDIRTTPTDAGLRVTWSQTITKPLRLDLDFEVMVDGDRISGRSRAGRLPGTAVTGTRLIGTRVVAQ